MLIVGELINSSRKVISEALERKDARYIQQIALEQVQAGADYIDVNCGTQVFNEVEVMEWLVETIQAVTDAPLCIDSPNPQAIEAGLARAKTKHLMINSITGEEERCSNILPLMLKYNAKIVALCMDDRGMPDTAEDRVRVARELHKNLVSAGVPEENIYFDPLIKPISTNQQAGREVLEAVRLISEEYPNAHKICGLSNVSYGLPNRKVLNQLFMVQTMAVGMDSYILNPLDRTMMGFVYAAQALAGKDDFCLNYLKAYRKGLYERKE